MFICYSSRKYHKTNIENYDFKITTKVQIFSKDTKQKNPVPVAARSKA